MAVVETTRDSRWQDDMPGLYDRCLGPPLFAPVAAEVARRVAGHRPGRILEIAAGTGILTAELVRQLPQARVTATDLNQAMVDVGARRVPAAHWQAADATDLPFPDGNFDAVACQFGLMFVPDKPRAFAEIRRVLAASSAVTFTVWDAVETCELPAAVLRALTAVLPERTPDFFVRIPHGYRDPDRIRADVLAGGLADPQIERLTLRGRAADARTLATGFCYGTPLRFALAERGDLDALTTAVGDALVAELGDGPVEGELQALLVTTAA